MFTTISPISVLFASVTPFWLVSGQLMIPCENYDKHVYPKIILFKIKWNAINKCGNRFIFFFPPFLEEYHWVIGWLVKTIGWVRLWMPWALLGKWRQTTELGCPWSSQSRTWCVQINLGCMWNRADPCWSGSCGKAWAALCVSRT